MTDAFTTAFIEAFLVVVDGFPELMTVLAPSGRYIAVHVTDRLDDRRDIYLAAPVPDEKWRAYLSEAVDLRSLFTECATGDFRSFDIDMVEHDEVRLNPFDGRPVESQLPLPGFLSGNHTEDYEPRRNHIELLARIRFNEPVLFAGALARMAGYGELDGRAVFILRARKNLVRTNDEAGIVFLHRLRDHGSGDRRVCDTTSDFSRIDDMLTMAGVPVAETFIMDVRPPADPVIADRTPGPGDHIRVRDRRDGAIAIESDYIKRVYDSEGMMVASLRDAGFAVPLRCCEFFEEENGRAGIK